MASLPALSMRTCQRRGFAIAVITTYQQAAFDSQGDVTDAGPVIMSALAKALGSPKPIPG